MIQDFHLMEGKIWIFYLYILSKTAFSESLFLIFYPRLPDGDKHASHLRDIFYRMGFDDRGIVALSGTYYLIKFVIFFLKS